MTFLNSIFLAGLIAAALPILIHLFTRQKLKKIEFSSLKFLKEMRHEKIRRVKLRQILLLILRTLTILLLALAFARPALRGNLSSGLSSNAKTSVAIILDNSLSMSREVKGGQIFDIAKQKARDIIEILKPGDEAHIFLPEFPGSIRQIGPKYNIESLKRVIQNIRLSYKSSDFIAAILAAQEVLENSKNINREIYLISDIQKNGFRQLQQVTEPLLHSNIRFYILPITSDVESNLGIEKVQLANQIFEKGKTTQIDAVVKNHGQSSAHNKLVQLFIGGRRSAQATVDLKPGESQKVAFRFTPENTGFQAGYVLLEDDDLSRDNQRFFNFYVPSEIKVLLVGRAGADFQHIKLALQPTPGKSSTIVAETCLSDQLLSRRLSDYHTIILSNVPKIDGAGLHNLFEFVDAGGGLILFLGSDVNARLYNDTFLKRFKLPQLTEPVGNIGNRNSFISFGKIDYSHPIFSNVFESKKRHIESPQFYFSFKIDQKAEIDPIIKYDNDYPCLFETKSGKGKILVFTTALDFDWSDMALKGIFVPLLNRSVSYLAGSTDITKDELLIGAEIYHSSGEIKSEWELEMKLPDENSIRIRPKIQKEKFMIRFSETEYPGIYELFNRNTKIGQWAVNVASEESEIKPIDIEQLKEMLGTENVFIIKTNENPEKTIEQLRFGQELWKICIFIVLILLILEMLLYREKQMPLEIPREGTKEGGVVTA